MFFKMLYIPLDHFYALNEFDTSRPIFSVSSQVDARKIYTELASKLRTCFSSKFVRNKRDPLCYEVELIESSSKFAHVCFKDGKNVQFQQKIWFPNHVKTLLVTTMAYKHLYLMTTPKQRLLQISMNSNLKLRRTFHFPMNCRMQLKKQAKLTKCYRNQLHPI